MIHSGGPLLKVLWQADSSALRPQVCSLCTMPCGLVCYPSLKMSLWTTTSELLTTDTRGALI